MEVTCSMQVGNEKLVYFGRKTWREETIEEKISVDWKIHFKKLIELEYESVDYFWMRVASNLGLFWIR
jgi:hypothetical protein